MLHRKFMAASQCAYLDTLISVKLEAHINLCTASYSFMHAT